ncbi:MAG: hypothetical protein IJV03_01825, partial [Alphaproteobacteria bacterium]|nr:hypothetical protein [Alphaproteobacteria bacterium]
MVLNRRFLIALLLLAVPYYSFGADVNALKSDISSKTTIPDAIASYESGTDAVLNDEKYKSVSADFKQSQKSQISENINSAKSGAGASNSKDSKDSKEPEDTRTAEEKKKALEEAEKNYADKKANEQSTANKTLTALTTAATGIGGMELAMGLSQQKADKEADANMTAYLESFSCSYGEGKRVKAGIEEIELPGGNDAEMMKLRAEYIALANDLKERKTALGMKPGIESEEILDKATMGLYDDESIGITNGAYSSLYRAKMLGSEEDQAKIDSERKASKNRVIAGGVLVGAGVVGGIIGNSAINGKLAEKIKEAKAKKEIGAETEKALKVESDALEDLQKCLEKAGVNNTDSLSFSNFYVSSISVKNINCKKDIKNVSGKYANDLFVDSADTEEFLDKLLESFGPEIVSKMVGTSLSSPTPTDAEKTNAKNILDRSQETAKKRIEDAKEKDKQ